jgi:hypothetical protein
VISEIRPAADHSGGIFDEDQGGQAVSLLSGLEEALWRRGEHERNGGGMRESGGSGGGERGRGRGRAGRKRGRKGVVGLGLGRA